MTHSHVWDPFFTTSISAMRLSFRYSPSSAALAPAVRRTGRHVVVDIELLAADVGLDDITLFDHSLTDDEFLLDDRTLLDDDFFLGQRNADLARFANSGVRTRAGFHRTAFDHDLFASARHRLADVLGFDVFRDARFAAADLTLADVQLFLRSG